MVGSDLPRKMGNLWPLTLALCASWYFQSCFCGSFNIDHELLLGSRPARSGDPPARGPGRETLFGPRRMALQHDKNCVFSVLVCPNNEVLTNQAYAAIAKGPCSPLPGLDLVRCGTSLSSREVVQSVLAGTCEVRCRNPDAALDCPSTPAQVKQGDDHLKMSKISSKLISLPSSTREGFQTSRFA